MLGRVRMPARSPASPLVCSPPTSPPPSAAASVPLADGLPRCRSLFFAVPRMPLRTRSASETGHRLSARPVSFRGEARTSQVPGPSSSCAPWSNTPPDTILPCPNPSSRRSTERPSSPPGHPEWHSFRGRIPTAHTLACLRFAGPVAETVARLATGSGGLTPRRAGFAPAGRQTKFHEVIASSIPLRPAVPGRTELPSRPRGAPFGDLTDPPAPARP